MWFHTMKSYFSSILPQKPVSSLSFKTYPTLRDHPLHTSEIWLEGKRCDDGAEGLWRIYDDLYDFSIFIDQHPGGKDWLILTKGTDITEAFETHHMTKNPKQLLSKYFVRKTSVPRNSPFVFKEDGFYQTLKRNVSKEIEKVPAKAETLSKIYSDFLFISYLALSCLTALSSSITLAIITGIFLALSTVAAHNFFHKKDNFRMYYFDFSLMSSRSWRVTHALSHHIYTNTVYDYEISFVEPFIQLLPVHKHIIWRYPPMIFSPIIYFLAFIASYIRMLLQILRDNGSGFQKTSLLPFTVLLLMSFISRDTFFKVLFLYGIIIISGSFYFGFVGISAGHHHPDIFHDGDTPRKFDNLDWGMHQMDAVMDREEFNYSHFIALVGFGDHTLHHLFPTIDQGKIRYLYPILQKTCKEFGVDFRLTTQWSLILGVYTQFTRIETK